MTVPKKRCAECLMEIGELHESGCELKGTVTQEQANTHRRAFPVYCMECQSTEKDEHVIGCSAWVEQRVGERREPKGLLEEGGPVMHPKHYNQHPAGIECIDVIEHMTLNVGTAVKYLWRTGLKKETFEGATEQESAVRDLHSAIWYIQREIERIEQPFTMRKGPKAK